ncbi:predicted protein [Uncinocarpus reesii 1704]|uniref:Uncharacterized protein n=1 Tax=Uncinocarpus reesii (strain UAMH 1704) TaxID=336963 RepID=C4JW77_UNCRE|nr:uncharacterized protein UREG_06819 [Uncinocarpus reesii 1704]EEP81954.1 predicted protein [Uncinocarpus reesii 1704]
MATATKFDVTDPRVQRKKVMIKQLRAMYADLKQFKPSSLNESYLERFNIKLLPLDLVQPAKSGPCFYKPMSEDTLSTNEKDYISSPDPEDGFDSRALHVGINLGRACLDGSTDWKTGPIGACYEGNPGSAIIGNVASGAHYDWGVDEQVVAWSNAIPHCKFQIHHDTAAEERLRPSEVLPILAVMRWRMGLWRYLPHEIFPVGSVAMMTMLVICITD